MTLYTHVPPHTHTLPVEDPFCLGHPWECSPEVLAWDECTTSSSRNAQHQAASSASDEQCAPGPATAPWASASSSITQGVRPGGPRGPSSTTVLEFPGVTVPGRGAHKGLACVFTSSSSTEQKRQPSSHCLLSTDG